MNRRNFLLGLGSLAALSATPAYAQVWRRICTSTTTGTGTCSGGVAVDWKQICTSDGNCAGKGYFGGGGTGVFVTVYAHIDGISFVNDVAFNPAATLSDAPRLVTATANSTNKGYFAGGFGIASHIDGIVFATEVAFNPAATLSDGARHGAAGVNSSVRGYFGGGTTNPSTTVVNFIDGIEFSTDSAVNPVSVLQDGARGWLAGISSAIRGYFCGGTVVPGSVHVGYIDGIRFDTEAAINPAAMLSTARGDIAGINSSTAGYLGGGFIGGTPSNEIDGLMFATEAAINPSASLGTAKGRLTGVNSSVSGYFAGGSLNSSTSTQAIDRFQFTTETTAANVASLLDGARFGLGGVQSGGMR